jgi:phosphoesterase RecJ-like protein
MIPRELITALTEGKNYALLIHTSPDGDAIGSSLALAHTLVGFGKKVDLLCQDTMPDSYEFLEGIKFFKRNMQPEDWYDIAVIVDCSDLERLGSLSGIVKCSAKTLNIDHHITNSYFADINYVDIKSAATAEIIYEIILELAGTPGLSVSEALYTGILTDTGNFSFSNVTPRTHSVASELISQGVNPEKVSTLVYKNHSLNKIKLWGRAIDSLETDHSGKFAMITITSDMIENNGAKEFDVEGVVNFALDIKGVELAVLIREMVTGGVKVSFRSKNSLDVSRLAAQFGGGGHKKAAGCIMKEGIDQSKAIIKTAAGKIINDMKA